MTLRVLDTATGAKRSYVNEPGDFCGQADTVGFPDRVPGGGWHTSITFLGAEEEPHAGPGRE